MSIAFFFFFFQFHSILEPPAFLVLVVYFRFLEPLNL
jgi:hypothetical protein